MRVLVMGAAGSGTSTLGRAAAVEFGAAFVEADDLYWQPTDPPFKEKRSTAERAALLRQRLSPDQRVVVSGSIMGWDRELEGAFDLIVFLRVPAALRVERLRGARVADAGSSGRGVHRMGRAIRHGNPAGSQPLARHLAWLRLRRCPVLELSGATNLEDLVSSIQKALSKQ